MKFYRNCFSRSVLFGVALVGISSLIEVLLVNSDSGPYAATAIAVVTDREGKSEEVSGFYIYYSASGTWIGSVPYSNEKSFHVLLQNQEGRVAVRNKFSVPLSSVKSIAFEWVPSRYVPVKVEIKKRDGHKVIISYTDPTWKIEEFDISGVVLKKTQADSLWFSTVETVQDRFLEMDRFCGEAKTKSGAIGDYSISLREVSLIVFW